MAKITRIPLFLAILLLANSCLVGKYMCNYSLLPEEHGNDFEGDRAKTESRYPGIIAWYDNLHDAGVFRDAIEYLKRKKFQCGNIKLINQYGDPLELTFTDIRNGRYLKKIKGFLK